MRKLSRLFLPGRLPRTPHDHAGRMVVVGGLTLCSILGVAGREIAFLELDDRVEEFCAALHPKSPPALPVIDLCRRKCLRKPI